MKILNKAAYADYRKDKSFYDTQDLSDRQLAIFERFTPARGRMGPVYTCEPVVLISGEELLDGADRFLGRLWSVRSLVALDSRKKKGVVERYDILVIEVDGLAYRLVDEAAEYAEAGYYVRLVDPEAISEAAFRSVVNGVDAETGDTVDVETPEWFIGASDLANPLIQ